MPPSYFVIFPISDPRACAKTTQRDFRQLKTPPYIKCTLDIDIRAPQTRAYGSGELFGTCLAKIPGLRYRKSGLAAGKLPNSWAFGKDGSTALHEGRVTEHGSRVRGLKLLTDICIHLYFRCEFSDSN